MSAWSEHYEAAERVLKAFPGSEFLDDPNGIEDRLRKKQLAEETEARLVAEGYLDDPNGIADLSPHTSLSPHPHIAQEGFHGLIGRLVSEVAPYTEADRNALLLTALTCFGAQVGPGPHAVAEGSRHPARLFYVAVGSTSNGRKGTSFSVLRPIFTTADIDFMGDQVLTGLSSGEGLIQAAADAKLDKRFLIVEPELARSLKAANREGSTLSPILRSGWDGEELRILTRSNPLKATGVHMALIGHITPEELRKHLAEVEFANGFANRFLFGLVRRSQLLPEGGNLPNRTSDALGREIHKAVTKARTIGRLERSTEAKKVWAAIYEEVSEDRGGLLGAVTARAPAQLLRLQVAYALLDGSSSIEIPHIQAAKAVWDYCVASAAAIFGASLGDRDADRLVEALKEAGPAGMDLEAQNRFFKGHLKTDRLEQVRSELARRGLAFTTSEETRGRPRRITRSAEYAE